MGTYIDGLHYTDDEYTIGPDGKATPKRRKVLGMPAPKASPEPFTPVEVDPPAAAPGPAEDHENTSDPTYQTKVITPAAPAAPRIETKGADRDPGTGKGVSGNFQAPSRDHAAGGAHRR